MFTWLGEYEFFFTVMLKLFLLALVLRAITLIMGVGGYVPVLDEVIDVIVGGTMAILNALSSIAPSLLNL